MLTMTTQMTAFILFTCLEVVWDGQCLYQHFDEEEKQIKKSKSKLMTMWKSSDVIQIPVINCHRNVQNVVGEGGAIRASDKKISLNLFIRECSGVVMSIEEQL